MHPAPDRGHRKPAKTWRAALALGVVALPLLSVGAAALGESVQPLVTDVLEGEPFTFRIGSGVGDTQETVQVTCPSCGRGWTTTVTRWENGASPGQHEAELRFPSTPFGAKGEPRWAQPYTISVGGEAGPAAAANVTVHIVDAFRQPNATYEVTDQVLFQVAGVADGQWVTFNVSKWSRTGALKGIAEVRTIGSGGVAKAVWRIPVEQAADMDCPHIDGKCRNYTVTASGAGRLEREGFHAQPAQLNATLRYKLDDFRSPGAVPGTPGPLVYNRTETVHALVDVRYHNHAPVRPDDLRVPGNASRNGTLRLAVERVTLQDGAPPVVEVVQPLWARSTASGWLVDWHIPKNLTPTVVGLGSPAYRIALLEQEDKWGNRIPATPGTTLQVSSLRMQPAFTQLPTEKVERLANASAVFRITYADGTPFTDETNATAMRASLLDANGDNVESALLRHLGNGTWSMSYQPTIRFRTLGFYQLRLEETRDDDGNDVVPTESPFFEVVPASPRVHLTTRVGFQERNETQGFVRGEVVDVEALVTYAGGRAFNLSRLSDGNRTLPLVVTKLDATGQVRDVVRVDLLPADDAGHWATQVPLPDLDDTNPLGPWRWEVQVTDNERPTPNRNLTAVFTRWLHGAALDVGFSRQPESLLLAGKSAEARFRVSYPRNHTTLDEAMAGSLGADVLAWDGREAGQVVASMPAAWDALRGEWRVVWETNRTTYVGEYVLQVRGEDVHGNPILSALSRPVKVYVDRLARQVLREPLEQVHRGETALVVFDGAEGDLGLEGEAAPRIEAQKWNPDRQVWEVELRDVRDNATDGLDHLGRLATSPTTNLGMYRFALVARNAQYAVVHGESRAFRMLPVEVPRAWVGSSEAQVVKPVTKGTLLSLQLERQEGDQLERVVVLHRGQEVDRAKAFVRPGRFDVSWAAGYRLADGLYEVRAYGVDLHNNTFASPALQVNLTGVGLQVNVAAQNASVVPRAGVVELRATFQYPDLAYARNGSFVAEFLRGGEVVETRVLESNRSSWVARWAPPAAAPLGTYVVRIHGDDGMGNSVDQAEAYRFQIAEGFLERKFSVERRNATRTEQVTWVLPADPQDQEMTFWLREETGGARRAMPSNLTTKGEYVVTWKATREEKLSRYVLEAEGMDAQGNALRAASKSLLLKPAKIGSQLLEKPVDPLPVGQTGRWAFQLRFADGTLIPASADDPPRVAMLSVGKLVEPSPSLQIEDGHWVATWTPEAGKHHGVFQLATGGWDKAGNEIQGNTGIATIHVSEGFLKDVLGVPGFEAALAPVVMLGVALALRARRR